MARLRIRVGTQLTPRKVAGVDARWRLAAAITCSWASALSCSSSGTVAFDEWEREGQLHFELPFIYVLAIDDDSSAAGLQTAVREMVRAAAAQQLAMRQRPFCQLPYDPASWHPGDAQTVVVPPSGPTTLVTSQTVPELRWQGTSASEDEADRWANAAIGVLDAQIATAGPGYRLLEHMHGALSLALGERDPTNAEESAFVTDLPERSHTYAALISARDDDSPLPPESYASTAAPAFDFRLAVVPDDDGSCSSDPWGAPRLGAWVEAQRPTEVRGWPCGRPSFENGLHPGFVDCSRYCIDDAIAVDDAGRAACRITIEIPNAEACSAERGWQDPDGVATYTERVGVPHRLCEIRQLAGATLAACRHTFECEGCESGWCATEVAELLEPSCEAGQIPNPLRYVGGALAGASGWLRVVCQLPRDE